MNSTFKKNIVFLFGVIFFSLTQTSNAQWKYENANQLKSEVIINYEVIYDKEPTDAQKKSKGYYDNIVVIFNGSKMKEQIIYKNLTLNSFAILDYDNEKIYRCNQSSKTSKFGIVYDFKAPKVKVNLQPEEHKTILNFECNKAIAIVHGLPKAVYYTKKIGLRYCKQFAIEGFALEYPSYSKTRGHYRVVAKTIHYKTLEPSIFALDDYRIYTKDEYKALKNKSTERYAKSRFENVGKPFESFRARSMTGKKLFSKDMAGEVIVLNFWFTTCPPCKKEIPQLNKLKEAYKDKNVNFIAIATDPEYRLDDFLRKNKFNYDIVAEGRWLADKYGISSYPTNIVIDKEGIIQLFEIGYKSDIIERMTYKIDKALGDEAIEVSDVDSFFIESPYIFTDGKIKLTTNVKYDNVVVQPTHTALEIETIDKNNVYISSEKAVSDVLTLKLTEGKNTELQQIDVHFYDHGTKDLETIEGIKLHDTSEKILKLLGEPNTISNGKKNESWYYRDGEISFEIDINTKQVKRINIFGFLKSYHPDNGKTVHYNKYKYDIADLGNFNNPDGIIMDAVVKKYGKPDKSKLNEGNQVEWYTYFLNDKKLIFHFSSEDINDYHGKKITFIAVAALSKKDKALMKQI